ncbi:MAG: hypothetical protein KDA38_04750, partial [Planctomycetales bacterium]|nr:hypothetical protein [Planctomycetales bacterium]
MSFARAVPLPTRLALVLGLGLSVLAVAAAWGDEPGQATPVASTVSLIAVAILAIVLAGLLVTALHKRSLADAAAAEWRRKTLAAEAILAAAPRHLRLDGSFDRISSDAFDQFCEQLAAEDRERLRGNANALLQHGHTFRVTVAAEDGQRHWRVVGGRGARDEAGRHADMLWIEDVSHEEGERLRLQGELEAERGRCRRLVGL